MTCNNLVIPVLGLFWTTDKKPQRTKWRPPYSFSLLTKSRFELWKSKVRDWLWKGKSILLLKGWVELLCFGNWLYIWSFSKKPSNNTDTKHFEIQPSDYKNSLQQSEFGCVHLNVWDPSGLLMSNIEIEKMYQNHEEIATGKKKVWIRISDVGMTKRKKR